MNQIMDDQEVRDAIYDWAERVLPPGETIVWANGNGPSPARPYITLQLTAKPTIGSPTHRGLEDGDEVVQIQREAFLSIQAFAVPNNLHQALDTVQSMRDSLELTGVLEQLRADGLAYLRTELGPQDAPAIAGTEWEPRAILDLVFGYRRRLVDETGAFETVIINGSPVTT